MSWHSTGNEYSWLVARNSFYTALTTGSEAEYAKTFRSLGQVMHLVADMAVPAHVRNDPHPSTEPFEGLTKKWVKQNPSQYASSYPPHLEIFKNNISNPEAPLPISALWDKDIYTVGTNPDILWTTDAGLAEFTNANFLSRDTFWQYPHPKATDTNPLYEINWHNRPTVTARDNKNDSPAYLWRMVGGQRTYRLAAASYFSHDTRSISPGPHWTLDDEVYKDYANILIPRAVGYSTALLDYFFRGTIEVTPPSRFVFGIIDDATFFDPASGKRQVAANGLPVKQKFTELKAKVRNTSADEMGSGIIQLVARYLVRNDYSPDLLHDPAQVNSVKNARGDFYPYSYSVSLPFWIPAMSKTTPAEYTFDFSDSPIPAGITDLDIFVVFKGTLGQEKDIAIAVGRVAEMNEPFHYAVENATDYEIGSTGKLYPNPGLSLDFNVCFNPYPGTCQYPNPTTLAPGQYSKMILLYAGTALGIHYKDTLWIKERDNDWINNLSRSKFLTNDSPAKIFGFRGIYNHANFVSYNSLYTVDLYSIPAFVDPTAPDFHPFEPMPERANLP